MKPSVLSIDLNGGQFVLIEHVLGDFYPNFCDHQTQKKGTYEKAFGFETRSKQQSCLRNLYFCA